MKIHWTMEESDIAAVRALVERYKSHSFVRKRAELNLSSKLPRITAEFAWDALASCLLTSQQKSGPGSAIIRLLDAKPFPLALDAIRSARNPPEFATKILKQHGGVRFTEKLGRQFAENLPRFEGFESAGLGGLGRLKTRPDAAGERRLANEVQDAFVGIGPKQSRNLLQILGVTRYEIPLDSRFLRWLRSINFPIPVSATTMSDGSYYEYVLDRIIELCARADVLPCQLDAAVFVSADDKARASRPS